ncbi:HemK methyltransferase family member 1 [Channa argus]|uniref:HemK methyltransferase family member 1 n=1 Tax=Channa argus TaxID=215402 RepID=A0A6G1PJ24_CHAAH|nr:HemK methyltransferase family member 1 [Channa argus]
MKAVVGETFILILHQSVKSEGFPGFHAMPSCSVPAIPAGKITALQAMGIWRRHFEKRGVTETEHSCNYIIAHLLGAKTVESLERGKLTEFLSREKVEQVWKLCTRRLSRMPVQYVIEEWDFRDLTLKMKPPVFIPRPETEELVDLVLTDLQKKAGTGGDTQHTCLEVGCGSGAISLSLLKSLPQLKAIALDKCQAAVNLTMENALRFEDHAALDGGKDGLQVIRQILTLSPQILSNHGRVYLEVDPRHPLLIQPWVEAHVEGLHYMETRHDITGRPRFCILQKEKSLGDRELCLGLRN